MMIGSKVCSEAPVHADGKTTYLGNPDNRSRRETVSTTAPGNDGASPRMSFSLSETAMLDSSPFRSCQSPLGKMGSCSQICGGVGTANPELTSVASADELQGDTSPPGTPAPSTPRQVGTRNTTTPPPWMRPRSKTESLLLRALERNATQQVRTLLESTPGIAGELFWDDGCEPPLCAAVRLKCSIEVFELLLAHGADTQAENKMNRTPIELLNAQYSKCTERRSGVFPSDSFMPMPLWMNEIPTGLERWHNDVAELLNAREAIKVG